MKKNMQPDQAIILITGVSRGIGRYLAEYYVSNGYRVIGCSRSASVDFVHKYFTYFQTDITSEASVVKMFRHIREQFGRLDALINNAGVNPTISLMMMTSMKAASETLNTNVLGTFVVSREAAKLMMRRKFGRIINMSSMAARHEVVGEAIYSASKAAIHSLTRVMAKEFNAYGITCNVVAPAAVETNLMSAVQQNALMEVLSRNAIKTVGDMSEISQLIDYLMDTKSQAVTGQVIYLGGA
jgi:3-oxoacyl-[acyl-carrier protein] reductase